MCITSGTCPALQVARMCITGGTQCALQVARNVHYKWHASALQVARICITSGTQGYRILRSLPGILVGFQSPYNNYTKYIQLGLQLGPLQKIIQERGASEIFLILRFPSNPTQGFTWLACLAILLGHFAWTLCLDTLLG